MTGILRKKLKGNDVIVGGYISIGHPDVIEVMSNVGFDFLTLDMEHGPLDASTVSDLLQVMRHSKTTPMVRVPWNDIVFIKRALDAGTRGIIVPMVSTKEDAVKAARAVRYPPQGVRGFGPRGRALGEMTFEAKTHIREANRDILLWVQIETKEGVENIDEILSVPGIDAMVIGPMDLTLSLGIPAQWDNPKYKDALKRVLDSCVKHDILPGFLASIESQKRLKEGFRILQTIEDYRFMYNGAVDMLKQMKDFASSL